MNDTGAGLIVAGIVILIVGFIVMMIVKYIKAERQRKEDLRMMAQEMGFEYIEKESGSPQYPMKLFQTGRSKYCKNILQGKAKGRTVMMCDYQYTTGSGRNSTIHNITICIVEDKGAEIPLFFLRKEIALFDWLGEKFGGQDFDFEDDPEFSIKFVLQGDDEERIRSTFGPDFRKLLLDRQLEFSTIESSGYALMANRGKRVKAHEFMGLLELAFVIKDSIT